MREADNHHLHYTKADHIRQAATRNLRNHPLSQIEMYIPVHRELHAYVPPLPADVEMARTALKLLESYRPSITSYEASQRLVDDLYESARPLSDHISRQIPFFDLSAKALRSRTV